MLNIGGINESSYDDLDRIWRAVLHEQCHFFGCPDSYCNKKENSECTITHCYRHGVVGDRGGEHCIMANLRYNINNGTYTYEQLICDFCKNKINQYIINS